MSRPVVWVRMQRQRADFNIRLKMLRELADLLFSEREFQTAGALTEKALADTFTPFFYLAELICYYAHTDLRRR